MTYTARWQGSPAIGRLPYPESMRTMSSLSFARRLGCGALLLLAACSDSPPPAASSSAAGKPADTAKAAATDGVAGTATPTAAGATQLAGAQPAAVKEVADFQIELLDVAYSAASK